ncbi:MAG: class I SAM-dependent methyltransferase [candidate division Zixibacteria bacterium]|nr:class I SAM-dependent methyltransferase [candidate division Zixibacteria bacterium]
MERKKMTDRIYGEFARYYDLLGWNRFAQFSAERLKNFVAFRGQGKETVLDLACGTGELEYRLKRTKMRFTGIDISWKMLTEARRKNKNVKFIHGDMTNVRLNQKFDIVVCFFDSVNHLSGITAIKRLFKTARMHLNKGGFFIFDMLTPEGLERWEAIDIRREKDYYVTINGHYDQDKIKAEVTIEGFVKSGRSTYQRFNQVVAECSFTLDKVAEALTIAGFDDISVTSFNNDEPIEETSRWFFVVR